MFGHYTKIITFLTCIGVSLCVLRDLYCCHNDYTLKTEDGPLKRHTFPWLGFIQYVHRWTKLVHHSQAPRVVLIHKQFVLTTAHEMTSLPRNYKLGAIVFGEYERDEVECKLTPQQIVENKPCAYAYLVIPHTSVLVHPEYSKFGISNSVAIVKLLRPLKSTYMIPICLPTLVERYRQRTERSVFLVDYLSAVPQDFDLERMARKTFPLYLHDTCMNNISQRWTKQSFTHVLCTPGCGVRLSSPIVSKTEDGRFEVIGLAASTAFCSEDAMRTEFTSSSPIYIDVYYYKSWITNVITANLLPRAYPLTYQVSEDGTATGSIKRRLRFNQPAEQQREWVGHTYCVGNECFKKDPRVPFDGVTYPKQTYNNSKYFFYSENFHVTADHRSKVHVELKVSSGIQCKITCAKLKMPVRVTDMIIKGVGGHVVSVEFNRDTLPKKFIFNLILEGEAQNVFANTSKDYGIASSWW